MTTTEQQKKKTAPATAPSSFSPLALMLALMLALEKDEAATWAASGELGCRRAAPLVRRSGGTAVDVKA